MKNDKIPAPGKAPRGKGGSRPLDHPGCGTMPKADNTFAVNHNASAGGKGHPGLGPGGSHESYKNAPKDLPSMGGKLGKVAEKW